MLSPTQYALYTNEITKDIGDDIQTVQFADDIAIYTTSRNIRNNKAKIENAIKKIAENLEGLGLELSPKKTVIVEYSKYGA